jgi:hypothetical protein
MEKTLEHKARVHYNHNVDSEDLVNYPGKIETERATIRKAYFGRYPTPGPITTICPLGLNISIDYQSFGSAGATYTDMKSIENLMNDFEVSMPEELQGREVVAHIKGMRLLGISVPEKE